MSSDISFLKNPSSSSVPCVFIFVSYNSFPYPMFDQNVHTMKEVFSSKDFHLSNQFIKRIHGFVNSIAK